MNKIGDSPGTVRDFMLGISGKLNQLYYIARTHVYHADGQGYKGSCCLGDKQKNYGRPRSPN